MNAIELWLRGTTRRSGRNAKIRPANASPRIHSSLIRPNPGIKISGCADETSSASFCALSLIPTYSSLFGGHTPARLHLQSHSGLLGGGSGHFVDVFQAAAGGFAAVEPQ